MNKTKFIFVTGGILSGLGKGVSAASIGNLLSARGYKIFVQKLDPYYNVDPGTMSPYQHGEVFVTKDGGETDLDLGHYERFIGKEFSKSSNYTQGQILLELLSEEREGKYGGTTVQVIPHVTNKIIEKIILPTTENDNLDFVIIEIGGTVGDIESEPFISAISQFGRRNPDNTFFIHCVYLPYLEASNEFKSKPSQHSISALQARGILPDMLLLRGNSPIPKEVVEKVSTKSFIDNSLCIPVHNIKNIYEIPLYLSKFNVVELIEENLKMKITEKVIDKRWQKFVSITSKEPKKILNVGMVGKYVEYEDAYLSIIEALKISGIYSQVKINLKWIDCEKLKGKQREKFLSGLDGVVVLPGFGSRGFEGKINAVNYTRDNDIPTLGICYGFQAMVIDQARRKGISDATTAEEKKEGTCVLNLIRGKEIDDQFGGTLRLGEFKTNLKANSIISRIYDGELHCSERHRHRYEVVPSYRYELEDQNFIFSGFDAENDLAEICELSGHKFFIGTQAHPEFKANPIKEAPLFKAFIKSMI